MTNNLCKVVLTTLGLLIVEGCGGGGGGGAGSNGVGPGGPTNYSIGGSISGLTGTGLVLQDNAGDNLSVTQNGALQFATPLQNGASYSATILAQPSGQLCVLQNGSGNVASSNITTIIATCYSLPLASTVTIQTNMTSAYNIETGSVSNSIVACFNANGLSSNSQNCSVLAKQTAVQNFLSAILGEITLIKTNTLIDKSAISSLLASYQAQDISWLSTVSTPGNMSLSGYSATYDAAINAAYVSAQSQLNAM